MRTALALALASILVPLPAFAQRLGPEHGVAPPESGPQAFQIVQLGWDGTEQVVVHTTRTSPPGTSRLTVLDADSTVVRTPDVLLPLAEGMLACHPGECVLVGTQRIVVQGTGTAVAQRGVFAARFRTDGTLVDVDPLALAGPTDNLGTVSLARTGTGYLVTWFQSVSGTGSYVSRRLPLAGPAGAPVSRDSQGSLRVACHDTGCLMVRQRSTYVAPRNEYSTTVERLDVNGASIGAPVEIANTYTSIGVVTDTGVDYIVTDSGYNPVPRRWRIAYDGTVRELPAMAIGGSGLACDGTGACLVLASQPGWWRADDVIVPGTGPGIWNVSSAHCEAGVCVVLGDGGRQLYPVSFDGAAVTVGEPVEFVATGAEAHGAPLVVANDGTTHLALFGSAARSEQRIGAALVGPAGPVAGAGATGLAPSYSGDTVARLARGADGYALLLQARYSPTNLYLLDDTGVPTFGPLQLAPATSVLSIAWNGTHYLAAWAASGELRVQRLDAIGQRVDDAPRVVRSGSFQSVEVAWDGARWMLLTRESGVRVKAMRLEEDGTPIDAPTGFLVRDAAGAGARLAYGRGTHLAVWQDDRADGSVELRAARIGAEGEVLDLGGRVVATAPGALAAFDVVFDGARFVVGWSFVDDTAAEEPARILVRARSLALDGAMGSVLEVLDDRDQGLRGPLPGAPAPLLALDSAAPGRTLIAYTRQLSQLAEAPVRLHSRMFVDDSLGGACASDADCASGACSGGVCCDRACDGACEACGIDGVCAPLDAGTICRDAMGACDSAELCDGAASTCPAATIEDCDGGVTVPDAGMGEVDGGTVTDDAGVSEDDASTGAGLDGGVGEPDASAPTSPGEGGGGCAVGGAGSATPSAWIALLAALGLALRRRARRRA